MRMIGQIVSHYRIVKKLGQGGMGIVYLAEDLNLNRLVAIKTLNALKGLDDRQHRRRFQREAEAASTLKHPHIATIYEFGKTLTGEPFIVMEFVDGSNLDDLIRKEALTISRSVQIIKEVAEALGEAHRHGIIHRDIKPSNVVINREGQVRVLDFGLAKQVEVNAIVRPDPDRETILNTQTREGIIVGTPLYLSPEQALSVEVDARSDLFSLGTVLYECIAGRSPFLGGNSVEICTKVIRDDPPPPSHFNRNISAELDRITLKSLAKKPEERYQTADEVVEDIERFRAGLQGESGQTVTRIQGLSAQQTRSHIFETLSDIFQRPRLSVGYFIAGLLLLSLVAFGVWRLTRPKAHQPTAEAQKWYEVGSNYLREGAYFKAVRPLQEAINADPKFALAHARLAEAWTELDYTERAQMELLRVDGLVPDRSVLSRVDLLYLDAIRNTITRDFSGAVNAYSELAKNKNDDAQVYFDLARALERNDELDRAIQSLQTAIEKDPQYAPAYLRYGVLYGRKEELPKASAAFDKADSLFTTLGDFEGSTEVLFQRGTLLTRTGKLTEAQTYLEKALEIARTSSNEYQQIKAMLQLSITLQLRGNTEPAQRMATDAVDLAQRLGLENLATQGLIDLGDTYVVRREYVNAESNLKQALDFAQRNKGRRNEARAWLILAKLYIQQEINTDVALTYVDQALKYFQLGGYNKEVSLAILLRGRAKLLKGEYDAALQDFQQQIEFSQKTNNQTQLASTLLLVGNLNKSREHYPDALVSFQKSFEIYQTLDVPMTMAYLLVDQSQMLWRLGQYAEAKRLVDQVPNIANRLDNKYRQIILARQAVVESQIALSEENRTLAIDAAKRSIRLFGNELGHTGVEARAQLALSQIRSGLKKDGLKTSNEAVEMAKLSKDEYLLSSTLLANAEALLANDNYEAAIATAQDTEKRFHNVKQLESELQAWFVIALAAQKKNDPVTSNDAAKRAGELMAELEKSWGSPAFERYKARADIKSRWDQVQPLVKP